MYEFLKIYQRMPGGEHDRSLLRIGALPGGKFSQSLPDDADVATYVSPHGEFREYWQKQLKIFNTVVKGGASKDGSDIQAIEIESNIYAFKEWMDCVSSRDQLERLIGALRGDFDLEELELCPRDDELEAWAAAIERNTDREEIWFKYARNAWDNGEQERAKKLFRHAIIAQNHSKTREELIEILKQKYADSILDQISAQVLKDLLRESPGGG